MRGLPVITTALMTLAFCNAIFKATGWRVRPLPLARQRLWARPQLTSLLRFFVNEENMMLKLILILSSSLALAASCNCAFEIDLPHERGEHRTYIECLAPIGRSACGSC